MNIIERGTIRYWVKKHPSAKLALIYWYYEFLQFHFKSFKELKKVYEHASLAANNRVVFNIQGDDFRLIVSCNFSKKAACILWFGTRKEYDKTKAETIGLL